MVRDADVADHALALRLEQAAIQPVRIFRIRQCIRVVKLQQIDVVRLHPLQAGFDILQQCLLILGRTLRRDDDVFTHVGKGHPDLLFTIRIAMRRIEVIHSQLIGLSQQLHRLRLR